VKKIPEKKQRKAKKPDLKVKKQTVKDLDPEKASQQIKGGQAGARLCGIKCESNGWTY
jgi:hypothetical protein